MQLRDIRNRKTPELNIIPMIDIMFFLLVFFMLSTMYMIDLKTIPVKLPKAASAATDTSTTFAVSMKSDGSIYLGDTLTDMNALIMQASMEQKNNPNFAIVIRAERDIDYGKVITLIDKLKGAGITRFGLATDGADK
ncbi:biopolymer transporter ExbD [uncultured Phascolarctobacterium sp.]|uniref:ExbD/TolR family protein n=1 Tax=uncultured Phascolarctobacterium sp. TaxID=512296 RepID=UPI0025F00782|nr:biopolymer transporter ExbD [uncultured Phascolarctobacterium sp.]